MNTTHFDKEPSKPGKGRTRFSKLTSFTILAAIIAVMIGVGAFAFSESPTTVGASGAPEPTPRGSKKYIATRDIVIDRATGRARKPNDKELAELVEDLSTLTKRPEENLQTVALPSGGVALDADNGFAGTMLARPKPDGTFETKCVFTFEEAAEFLGLVEENS